MFTVILMFVLSMVTAGGAGACVLGYCIDWPHALVLVVAAAFIGVAILFQTAGAKAYNAYKQRKAS